MDRAKVPRLIDGIDVEHGRTRLDGSKVCLEIPVASSICGREVVYFFGGYEHELEWEYWGEDSGAFLVSGCHLRQTNSLDVVRSRCKPSLERLQRHHLRFRNMIVPLVLEIIERCLAVDRVHSHEVSRIVVISQKLDSHSG